jgi:hypothetical protein
LEQFGLLRLAKKTRITSTSSTISSIAKTIPTERQNMKDPILDIIAALTIAAALLVCALAYFDILTK